MIRKKGSLILCGAFLFVTWNAVLVLLLWSRPPSSQQGDGTSEKAEEPTDGLMKDLFGILDAFANELDKQRKILLQIQTYQSVWVPVNNERPKVDVPRQPVIPILVIACNRVTVKRCLDKLLQHRPSAELYPIIVSQDCGHAETAAVISSYGAQVTHLKQPDLSDIAVRPEHKKFQGYYKISRHYHWALNQVFKTLSHTSVIVVEDDLEVIMITFHHVKIFFK